MTSPFTLEALQAAMPARNWSTVDDNVVYVRYCCEGFLLESGKATQEWGWFVWTADFHNAIAVDTVQQVADAITAMEGFL